MVVADSNSLAVSNALLNAKMCSSGASSNVVGVVTTDFSPGVLGSGFDLVYLDYCPQILLAPELLKLGRGWPERSKIHVGTQASAEANSVVECALASGWSAEILTQPQSHAEPCVVRLSKPSTRYDNHGLARKF